MKKTYILFILSYFAFLFSACTQKEELETIGETVNLSFSLDVEEFNIETRTQNIDEDRIKNLYVLVFDEDGNFITRRMATIYRAAKFTVVLPASRNKRILHFIANYNWDQFDDEKARHKNEGEILPRLESRDLIMWNRIVLNDGIDANSLSERKISLIRNMAKITVKIEKNRDTEAFVPEVFTVFDSPTVGTIVPFNPQNSEFLLGKITVPSSVEYNQKHAYKNLSERVLNPIYIFERNNSTISHNNYTSVVIRGKYTGMNGITRESYYKIDIIETDKITKEVKRLNIERNYWYKLTIKKVKREGYASAEEALLNAAGNNSSIDVIIERYPVIADLKSRLEVEKTLFLITDKNYELRTWAKYFPNSKTNVEKNDDLRFLIQEEDPMNPVFKENSLSANPEGLIWGKTSNPPADGSTLTAKIFVSKGDLSRVIRVILRKPYYLLGTLNGYTIKDPKAYIAQRQGAKAELIFFIPFDYPESLLPVEVNIYTQELYPAHKGLKTSVKGGKICYTYTATQLGLQRILFRSNMAQRNGEIQIKIDRFTDFKISYETHPGYVEN